MALIFNSQLDLAAIGFQYIFGVNARNSLDAILVQKKCRRRRTPYRHQTYCKNSYFRILSYPKYIDTRTSISQLPLLDQNQYFSNTLHTQKSTM